MLVADERPAADIVAAIRKTRTKELVDVEIFDLYKGDHVPAGQKSIAVRLRYRSPERTLTDDEVNRMHQRIIDSLVKTLNVSIR
jgi:phenylalanyl-tRNA synthetase beta chain